MTIFEKKLHHYRGTEGTSKNLNTFLKISNMTVDSTLAQAAIRRLSNCQFNACTIVDSTFAQPSNRRFCIVESTFVQPLNQRLCNRRIDACIIADPMLLKTNYFVLSYRKTLQTSTQTFFGKNIFEILHIGSSANTAKLMVSQSKI